MRKRDLLRPSHTDEYEQHLANSEALREQERKLSEIGVSLIDHAKKAVTLLQSLTEMAPGLNRNPYVQSLRSELSEIWQNAAMLK